MCTVTFIPFNNKIFITHNRDENSKRTKAVPPEEYIINGHTVLFPRDSAAGGTWIAINKNGAAAVLLNGAFIKHSHKPPYRKSRGLAFLDIIAAGDIFLSYHTTNLTGIEPFTIILWNDGILYECRWDGLQKHVIKPDSGKGHTWSSVTLYDDAVIDKRKDWFNNWRQQQLAPAIDDILAFHLSAGDGDAANDLRMNRNGQMLTVSITAMEIGERNATMHYLGLHDNSRTTHELNFIKAPAIQ